MTERTYDYAREKFWQAIHTLATNSDSIQERLEGAAKTLTRLRPATEYLPEEHRDEFDAILHELTKEEAVGTEGAIRVTTRNLTDEQGRKLAGRIFDIYTDLHGGL